MQKDGFRKHPFYYAHLKIIILPQSKNKSFKYTSHGFSGQVLQLRGLVITHKPNLARGQ
jgi:hypothetical protein